MVDLKTALMKEIPEFKEAGEAFLKGEMSKMDFKKKSGGFGVYAHRDGRHFMIRLRILSGVLSKKQLKLIAHFAEKYAADLIHLTTRQAIQFHGMTLDDACHIMEEGLEHQIYTRGAGGNYPRNVAMSPLTGVEENEAFDVLPYAIATNAYFIERILSYHLPRKLKVAYSNNEEDTAHVTVQDLGFLAIQKDGQNYFRVYAGGGLGRNPRPAVVVEEALRPREVLCAVEAMVNFYKAEGDYENHGKARVRYILERMGEEAFKAAYKQYLEEARQNEALYVDLEAPVYAKTGTKKQIEHPAVKKQKQPGLYSYYFHPAGGQFPLAYLKRLNEVIAPMKEVYGRLSMCEGLYLINLTAEEAIAVGNVLDEVNAIKGVGRIRSCIGVPICQMGVLESQATLQAILDYFKTKNELGENLPEGYISGCPNSCGVHQIGGIGLAGKKKKIDGTLEGVYDVYVDGSCKVSETRLGTLIGEVRQSKVPEWLYALDTAIKSKQVDFKTYLKTYPEDFKALLDQYSV